MFDYIDVIQFWVRSGVFKSEFYYGYTSHFRINVSTEYNNVDVDIISEHMFHGRTRIHMQKIRDGHIRNRWYINKNITQLNFNMPHLPIKNFMVKVSKLNKY